MNNLLEICKSSDETWIHNKKRISDFFNKCKIDVQHKYEATCNHGKKKLGTLINYWQKRSSFN